MGRAATYALRLPRSIKDAVQRAAERDGVSMNQFMASAVAEKLAVFETLDYLKQRAARADLAKFDRIMSRPGGEPPREGDAIPAKYLPNLKRRLSDTDLTD